MLWCFLGLWICPQFVHIFNPVCTHACVPVCFAAFLLSSGMCLQSPVVCIWTERCAQVVFTKRLPHKVTQQKHTCIPGLFINKHLREISMFFMGLFFQNPGANEFSRTNGGKTLAKAVTFWLLPEVRLRSSTLFEMLHVPQHQWNQGFHGWPPRNVPHL